MKKSIIIGIFSLLLMLLIGCQSSDFGIRETGTEVWIERHGQTALGGSELSVNTQGFLLRSGLVSPTFGKLS